MHRVFAIFILVAAALPIWSVDSVTVDAAGVMTVNGTAPASAAATEVKVGGGQIKAGGSIASANATITRTTAATVSEVVRGDDPRLVNARPASGGDSDTVDGKHAADLVPITQKGAANGVATLDASGKVPAAQLPPATGGGGIRGFQPFLANGTFTVPANVTSVLVEAWGGGGGGNRGNAGGGGSYACALVAVVSGQSVAVTVGTGGAGSTESPSGNGGATSFGTFVVAGGGFGDSDAGVATAGQVRLNGAVAIAPFSFNQDTGPDSYTTVYTGHGGASPRGGGADTRPGGGGSTAASIGKPGGAGMVVVTW